jgi:anion-transporting  ArsA/GET3 family ATPase
MNLSAEEALAEYLQVQFHINRIAKPLISSQLVYYVTHAAPGLRDILVLGKVWFEATRKDRFDLIILDTPAAGHAVSMLRSPGGFLHAVPIGPLANHARSLAEWLQDPDQVAVQLVSMPEEMPVAETIETAELLEEKLGMDVSTVLVNKTYASEIEKPDPDGMSRLDEKVRDQVVRLSEFYEARRRLQRTHLQTLHKELSATASIIELPYLFTDSFGIEEVELIAQVIEEAI